MQQYGQLLHQKRDAYRVHIRRRHCASLHQQSRNKCQLLLDTLTHLDELLTSLPQSSSTLYDTVRSLDVSVVDYFINHRDQITEHINNCTASDWENIVSIIMELHIKSNNHQGPKQSQGESLGSVVGIVQCYANPLIDRTFDILQKLPESSMAQFVKKLLSFIQICSAELASSLTASLFETLIQFLLISIRCSNAEQLYRRSPQHIYTVFTIVNSLLAQLQEDLYKEAETVTENQTLSSPTLQKITLLCGHFFKAVENNSINVGLFIRYGEIEAGFCDMEEEDCQKWYHSLTAELVKLLSALSNRFTLSTDNFFKAFDISFFWSTLLSCITNNTSPCYESAVQLVKNLISDGNTAIRNKCEQYSIIRSLINSLQGLTVNSETLDYASRLKIVALSQYVVREFCNPSVIQELNKRQICLLLFSVLEEAYNQLDIDQLLELLEAVSCVVDSKEIDVPPTISVMYKKTLQILEQHKNVEVSELAFSIGQSLRHLEATD